MRKTSTYARKRRAATAWERERHQHVNPVKEAQEVINWALEQQT